MKKFILLAAVAISLSSCNNEDNYIYEPVEVHISAFIGGTTQSRASDTKWGTGDEIGITMSGGQYVNMQYTTEKGDGKFTGNTIYFRNKDDQATITAYYPYSGFEGQTPDVIEATTNTERQTGTEQPKIDFLYAVKENVYGSEPNVSLNFSHMMSKLTLIFKNGNNGTDVGKITSCEINGLILEGTFNPVTGECVANADTPSETLSLTPSVTNETALPSLILFPQTVGKVTMKLTDNEAQTYSCELKFNDNCLASGNNYVYTITVKKTGLIINKCEITNWADTPLEEEATSD